MIKTATDLYNSYYQTGVQLALQETGLLKLANEADLDPVAMQELAAMMGPEEADDSTPLTEAEYNKQLDHTLFSRKDPGRDRAPGLQGITRGGALNLVNRMGPEEADDSTPLSQSAYNRELGNILSSRGSKPPAASARSTPARPPRGNFVEYPASQYGRFGPEAAMQNLYGDTRRPIPPRFSVPSPPKASSTSPRPAPTRTPVTRGRASSTNRPSASTQNNQPG